MTSDRDLSKPASAPASSGFFDTKIDYPNFSFEVTHNDKQSGARTGRITTPHGVIETPNYIFVGQRPLLSAFLLML